MKHFPLALIFIVLGANISYADHKRGLFAGVAGSYISNDTLIAENAHRKDVDIPALEINLGYKYNSLLSMDVRSGKGLHTRSIPTSLEASATGFNEYSIDSYRSYYWRPELINSEAKIYLLLGYTTLDFSIDEFQNIEDGDPSRLPGSKLSEKGKSYGLGVGWFINDKLTFNVEYRVLIEKDDVGSQNQELEFTTFTAGFDYRFDVPGVSFF